MLHGKTSGILFRTIAVLAVALGLYFSSLHSYLLFHSLVEISTISIAFTLFVLAWNARRFLANDCLKLLGIGYAFIAVLDLIHTLAYKGMGVFPGYGANLPTQLWIAARYLQAATLCAAPFFARRRVHEQLLLGGYLAVVVIIVAMVYTGAFPDCYVEGKGLTPFKIVSEYLITAILLLSLRFFHGVRDSFDSGVYRLVVASVLCTAAAEISFTAYMSVYGFANMLGHLFKFAAFFLIYRALLVTGFREPFELIFREMTQAEEQLRESNAELEMQIEERVQAEEELLKARDELEEQVEERTDALRIANEQLTRELRERERTEESLLRSEARLTEAQRIAHLGNWELDLASNSLIWSDEIYRMFEIDRQQFGASYDAFLDVIHPDDRELVNHAYTESVASRTPYEIVHRLLMKDGRVKYVEERCETIYDEAGRAVRSVGTVHDVTDRKLAEEAVLELNQQLEERVAERTAELEGTNRELERMNRLFVGRELRMVELKERIKELEKGLACAPSRGGSP